MANPWKKNKTKSQEVPIATTIENVFGTEYGVADYMGRKTYFEKDDSGAYSILSQNSDLNPHLFPGYDPKKGEIDNSAAVQRPDILTGRQENIARKAFRREASFNKNLAKNNQYNYGDQEMLSVGLDPNNPGNPNLGMVPFANNINPGDLSFIASMSDATFATPNFNQEEIDRDITNMMRGSGFSYQQAYNILYGTNPTGATPEKFATMEQARANSFQQSDQQAQINALVQNGMSLDNATKQVTSGVPINERMGVQGKILSFGNKKYISAPDGSMREVIGEGNFISPVNTPANVVQNRNYAFKPIR